MRTGFAAGALVLAAYLFTLAPGLTEIDSGELAAVAGEAEVERAVTAAGRALNSGPWAA